MTHLFVYGSLMFDEIWQRVVAGNYAHSEGKLNGFVRLEMRDEEYPGLIAGDGVVEGIIRRNVNDDDVARLDAFEGDGYSRCSVMATDQHSELIPVDVYVTRNDHRHALTDQPWDPLQFRQHKMDRFAARYLGFQSIKQSGRTSER